jgi:hypothetical protein
VSHTRLPPTATATATTPVMSSNELDPLSNATVIHDVDSLCSVFKDTIGGVTSDKDAVMETVKQNMDGAGLHRPYDFGGAEATNPTVVCEHTSQFTKCRLWIDEDSDEKVVFISETEAAAYEYKRRGFTEYEKSAISNVNMIPEKVRKPGMELSVFARPIPIDTVVADRIPPPRKDMTFAATVVEQFEDKIVDVKANEVYSPLRLWTKDARKGQKIPSSFHNRLNCYYAIKKFYANEDPSELTVSAKDLIRKARQDTSDTREPNADFWFDACIELYSNT